MRNNPATEFFNGIVRIMLMILLVYAFDLLGIWG